jgi:Mg-chelatase subunit ChlD
MRLFFIVSFIIGSICAYSQAQIGAEISQYDFGTIEQTVYQIQCDFVISNTGDKPLYILRADTDPKVKVKSSKRQIEPGDTASIAVIYLPNQNGSFSETIDIISNASAKAFKFKISGKIKNYTPDDKQACFSFQSPLKKKKANISTAIVKAKPTEQEQKESEALEKAIIEREKEAQQASRKKPLAEVLKSENKKGDTVVYNNTPKVEAKSKVVLEPSNSVFTKKHRSNNLIFLLDISSSMRDSTKLPYLKIAINELLDNVRDEDKITIITYADSIKVLDEKVNTVSAPLLKEKLNKIKAKGLTKGKEALQFATQLAVKHYIENGQNEIILASDGEFKYFDNNHENIKNLIGKRNIHISSICFGDDLKANLNLRKISFKGDGFFIKINSRKEAKQELLEKVKDRSLMK